MTILRPTDGVDVYFEKPADDTEHANFLRAKTDLEERRLKRINEVTLAFYEDGGKLMFLLAKRVLGGGKSLGEPQYAGFTYITTMFSLEVSCRSQRLVLNAY